MDSISVEIFRALSTSRSLKIQFIVSHDVRNNSANMMSFLDILNSVGPDNYLRITSHACTKDDVSRFLKVCCESSGLTIPITAKTIDLINESTKGIPLLIIQLIERY